MTTFTDVSNGAIPWKFNESVATIFQAHALKHIPDYQKIIDLSVQITLNIFWSWARVLDFGSALWYTIDKFSQAGFKSVYGIEKSEAMIQNSLFQERIILGDTIPNNTQLFDVIIANWTLHFIKDRIPTIHSFYQNLAEWGIIIITDKIASSEYIHTLYLDFKRTNGLSEAEIKEKTESLKWVLFPYTLAYYLSLFRELWFDTDIINASPCFVTFCLKKVKTTSA